MSSASSQNCTSTARRVAPALAALAILAGAPGIGAEEAELAPGMFLVAGHELRDPNFARTVVLLTSYSAEGAMGLVVNRRTPMELAELLPEVEELRGNQARLFSGGPVDPMRMLLLFRDAALDGVGRKIFGDVHLSERMDVLQRVAQNGRGEDGFRLYAGYAGWAAGQLDREVAQGDWHIVPAESDVIFAADPGQIWRNLVPRDPTRWVRIERPAAVHTQ